MRMERTREYGQSREVAMSDLMHIFFAVTPFPPRLPQESHQLVLLLDSKEEGRM